MTIPQGDTYKVLSFGAGVQSTALMLAACRGDLPGGERPDVAIFANTQWEPKEVMAHLKDMIDWAKDHDLELCTVTAGSIRTPRGASTMPLHLKQPDGSNALIRRQCTDAYKIEPIRKEIRRRLGYRKGQRWRHRLETWLGISTDEVSRMKPSQEKWETVRWPLIELGWSREDCKRYSEKVLGRQPVKSSCSGCPFHSPRYFAEMRKRRPEEFSDVVEFDQWLRTVPKITREQAKAAQERIRTGEKRTGDDMWSIGMLRGTPYLHPSRTPLAESYNDLDQLELFDNECSGYCNS